MVARIAIVGAFGLAGRVVIAERGRDALKRLETGKEKGRNLRRLRPLFFWLMGYWQYPMATAAKNAAMRSRIAS
jgi:hypothetical protein